MKIFLYSLVSEGISILSLKNKGRFTTSLIQSKP
jgi:hypothetical protein